MSQRRDRPDREARLRRQLPLQIASWASILLLALVIAVTHHHGWDISLLFVGLAIGGAGAVYTQLYFRLAPRLMGSTYQRTSVDQKMTRLQYTVSYAVVGVLIGVIAAAFNIAWAEPVAIIFLAVWWIGSLLAHRLLARRFLKRRPSNLTDGSDDPSVQPV